MTPLTKPVSRQTLKEIDRRPVIVTIAPLGAQSEARIGFRLLGRRTQYVCRLSDLYRIAAMWHGQKEIAAKKEARKAGVPWRIAKRRFAAENKIDSAQNNS